MEICLEYGRTIYTVHINNMIIPIYVYYVDNISYQYIYTYDHVIYVYNVNSIMYIYICKN